MDIFLQNIQFQIQIQFEFDIIFKPIKDELQCVRCELTQQLY